VCEREREREEITHIAVETKELHSCARDFLNNYYYTL